MPVRKRRRGSFHLHILINSLGKRREKTTYYYFFFQFYPAALDREKKNNVSFNWFCIQHCLPVIIEGKIKFKAIKKIFFLLINVFYCINLNDDFAWALYIAFVFPIFFHSKHLFSVIPVSGLTVYFRFIFS